MFVRKKKNRSDTISVVVVSKCTGRYKEIKVFGSSSSQDEINILYNKANDWISRYGVQQELDFDNRKGCEVEETERFIDRIDNVLINGTQLLLDNVYDSVGFNLGLLSYWIVNTIRFWLKQSGVTHYWTEIVRIMSTQKAITTEAVNAPGEKVHLRLCSEPNKDAGKICEQLKYKKMPFRKIKIE